MKIYIVVSLITGLLSIGVFAQDIVAGSTENANITSTTENANVTSTTENANVTSTTENANVTSTTENANVTSTTPIVSTTPIPNPPDVKSPEKGHWMVTENNITCIILDAAIQFHISYEREDKKVMKTKLNVPKNATVDKQWSSCNESIIFLTFDKNSFSLTFVKENDKVSAKEAVITYFINAETFPGAEDMGKTMSESAHNLTLFEVPTGKSYLCNTETTITFDNTTTASLTNVQVEAFKNSTKSEFSQSVECSSDEKINDIVPIAVGCALAALVIIVLIAYLVGRQRTRQRGYQSV